MSATKIWNGTAWVSLVGPQGPAGPTVVSADANNASRVGSDGHILTPPATSGTLGAIKVGFGLGIGGDGTLSVNGTIPFAATAAGLADTPSGTVGTSTLYARQDHTHPAPVIPAAASTAPLTDAATAAVGTSLAYARADHVHQLPTLAALGAASATHTHKLDDLTDAAVAAPAVGQVLRFNGTNFVNVALAYTDLTGTPVIPAAQVQPDWNAATGLGSILNKPTIPAAVGPSATAGLADTVGGTVGTSALYARADHTHPIPTLKADDLSDVAVAAPATGQVLRYNGTTFVNTALAYADLTGTPVIPAAVSPSATAGLADTASGTVGTSALYARADHTHPIPALKADDLTDVAVATPTSGQVLRYNGTNFVNAAVAYADITGTPVIPAAQVQSDWNAAAGLGVILNKPTIPTASSTTPLADGTAAVGTSATFARADHVHPAAIASATVVGGVKQGTGVSIAADGTLSATSAAPILKGLSVAAYTFVLADANQTVMNSLQGTNAIYTIPADATVNFPVGTEINIIDNSDVTTYLSPSTGVTLFWQTGIGSASDPYTLASSNIPSRAMAISGRFSRSRILKIGPNAWGHFTT